MLRAVATTLVAAGLVLSAPLLALDNAPQLGGEGSTPGIASGTLTAEGVSGCYIVVSGTITTNDVGGTVSAWFNVWDDGNNLFNYELPVPADGATHPWCYVYQVTQPILQGATGIGLYLTNGSGAAATVFYATDGSFNDASEVCTGPAPVCPNQALAIPTVNRTGLVALAALLGVAAAAILARRRATART